MHITNLLFVFVLAAFVGYFVITRVPPLLHTPLMSATNGVSGIIVVGALVVAGMVDAPAARWLGFCALVLGTINVVGGFLVTDRMLQMFKKREVEPSGAAPATLPAGNGKGRG